MTAEAFLATVSLFAELPADQLASIGAAGRTKSVGPGETVFREGDVSDGLYIVLAGKVRIYKRSDDGNEVELATGAVGEYFGELALMDGGTRSASVASLTLCEFFVLERETFLALLTRSPQLLATTLANLSRAVRATSERVFREALQQQTIRTEMELARYRSLAQMVAGVAHEINTPLGTVNTATSVVKGRLNAPVFAPLANDPKARGAIEDVREAIDLIEGNIRRAHKLVQDFKQLSVGQIRDTKETLDLVAVVDEVVGLFKINARQANLTIEVRNDLPDAAARAWVGYRGFLSQVLLNLMSNVERYAYPDGKGGRVEIAIAHAHRRSCPQYGAILAREAGGQRTWATIVDVTPTPVPRTRATKKAGQMVTEQKGRIARLKATGVDTALAELTLRALAMPGFVKLR